MSWDRNWGCRVEAEGTLRGWPVAVLQNETVRVTVLVGKGCDVIEYLYKPLDLDLTPRTARGLRSRDQVLSAPWSDAGAFLDQYEGGWQELLPSGGPPSTYEGAHFPQHGESSRAVYSVSVTRDDEECVQITCTTRLTIIPYRIEKSFTLTAGSSALQMSTTVHNESAVPLPLMWGHHLAFGAPFVGPSSRIEFAQGTAFQADQNEVDPSNRRSDGGSGTWPLAIDAAGNPLDLSALPPRGARSDLHFLEPPAGTYRLTSDDGRAAVDVSWDLATFPAVWFWQEFGATQSYPWWGSEYLIGLEPWTCAPASGLARVVDDQTVPFLAPGTQRSTSLTVSVSERHAQ